MFPHSSNETLGLLGSPPSIHILFSLHILLFPLTMVTGFIVWTVVRVSEKLHTPVNYLLALWSVINCVLGGASVLTSTIHVAGNGVWSYGPQTCILHQTLDTCIQCGSVWTLTTIHIYHLLQQTQPQAYMRYVSQYKRLLPTMVWLGAITQALTAVFISHTGFYRTQTNIWPLGKCINSASTKGNAIFLTISSFVIPAVIIIGFYSRMLMSTGRPLTRQVRLEDGMATARRRLVDEWQDMGVSVMRLVEGRQWTERTGTIRLLSDQNSRVSGMPRAGCPDLPIPHPRALRRSTEESPGTVGASSSEQLKEGSLKAAPERSHWAEQGQNGKGGNVNEEKKRQGKQDGSKVEGLEFTKEDQQEREGKAKANYTRKYQQGVFSLPQSPATPKLPCTPETVCQDSISLRSAFQNGNFREKSTSDMTSMGRRRQPTHSSSHCSSPIPYTFSPTKTPSDNSSRFFYSRNTLPTDSDSWPTVFLTADNLDQEAHDSPDANIDEKCPKMAPHSRTTSRVIGSQGDMGRTGGRHEMSLRNDVTVAEEKHAVRIHDVKALLLLLVPHMLLWLPHHILLIMVINDSVDKLDFASYATIEIMGKFSLFINPFMYLMFSSEFRSSLWSVLRCRDPNLTRNEKTEQSPNEGTTLKDFECDVVGGVDGFSRRLFNTSPLISVPPEKHSYGKKVSPLYSV